MSKITLYQCDMCHNRGETLRIFPVKVPNSPGSDVEFTQYDICDECAEKLNKYIQTFHKIPVNQRTESNDNDYKGQVWFVEYTTSGKGNKKQSWFRESGPFVEKKDAEKALNKAMLNEPMFQHRLNTRIVPCWVVDFIDCNIPKE